MKLYVVRHGITKNNKLGRFNGQRCDEPLEPEGFEQAAITKEKLPSDLVKIYSSDLLRAVQTAEVLNQNFNLEIERCPELREVDFGTLTGQNYKNSEGKYIDVPDFSWDTWNKIEYDLRLFGGESNEDVKKRIQKFINYIKSVHKDSEKILVVTHGGILRLMYKVYKNSILDKADNASLHEFEI
jgi:phosphoserine phosphatase